MTQTSMRAFLQEILAWILICALLTTPGLAQEAASQGQSPGQAGPGGANNPEVQLATEVQAKIEEQRRLNLAKLRERARALEGPTVIGDVAFAQQTLEGWCWFATFTSSNCGLSSIRPRSGRLSPAGKKGRLSARLINITLTT